MKQRIKLLFKLNNEVVLEENDDLYLNQIDALKWVISAECECSIDDIEVERIETPIDISEEVDISVEGLVFWNSLYMLPIQGVSCGLKEGTDEYLDAMNNGTIVEHLNFFM